LWTLDLKAKATMKVESILGNSVKMWCAKHGMILANYASRDRKALLHRFVRIMAQGRLLQNPADACQLISALRATSQIEGDIAEVGTGAGGSARLMSEYCASKTIHVFDTFEGLPKPGILDTRFSEGSYRCSLEDVQRYLQGQPVEFHKGVFPGSANSVQGHRFSFVHLDVDLYQSTLDSLRFFYPRMNPGGIIITHDYACAAGVDQAFAEFFADKPEKPIELIGYQAMVVKLS
jgi:O-methyltransferase